MAMARLAFFTTLSMWWSSERMPGRDWQTEFHARLFKRFFTAANKYGPNWSRSVMNSLKFRASALQKVELDDTEIANVPTLIITPHELDTNAKRILVYIHGGGYVTGSPWAYRAFLARLAVQSGLKIIAPDYRLSPEHPFPIPQQDTYAVVAALAEQYPDDQLVLMGDSAGGALCISTALHADVPKDRIAGLGLISPWVDPLASDGTIISNQVNDMFLKHFLLDSFYAHMNGADQTDDRVNFKDADLSSLPPLLIQVAGGEVFYDQICEFAERAKTSGVDTELENYPTQFHVFQTLAHGFEESKQARRSLVNFALK
ncbi:MAG: alpha/beta hydrolase [Pseudomonadota bacterium]